MQARLGWALFGIAPQLRPYLSCFYTLKSKWCPPKSGLFCGAMPQELTDHIWLDSSSLSRSRATLSNTRWPDPLGYSGWPVSRSNMASQAFLPPGRHNDPLVNIALPQADTMNVFKDMERLEDFQDSLCGWCLLYDFYSNIVCVVHTHINQVGWCAMPMTMRSITFITGWWKWHGFFFAWTPSCTLPAYSHSSHDRHHTCTCFKNTTSVFALFSIAHRCYVHCSFTIIASN